jgi:hypothetical protein
MSSIDRPVLESTRADGSSEGKTLAFNVPKKFKKKNKQTEEEKAIAAVGRYFSRKLEPPVSTPQPTSAKVVEDEDDVFCKMLAMEMKKVTVLGLKRGLKRKLLESVYSYQDEQEQHEHKQVEVRVFNWMMSDGASAQVAGQTGHAAESCALVAETVPDDAELLQQLQHEM